MDDKVTENIVVEARIAERFNLEEIAKRIEGVSYDPEEIPGVILNLPGRSFILFEDGRVICTGSRSMDEARKNLGELVDILRGNGFKAKKRVRIEIKNIVISTDIKSRIDLERFALNHEGVDFDPDEFPAAIYKGDGNLLALIFENGKIVCTGSREMENLERFMEEVIGKVKEVG